MGFVLLILCLVFCVLCLFLFVFVLYLVYNVDSKLLSSPPVLSSGVRIIHVVLLYIYTNYV